MTVSSSAANASFTGSGTTGPFPFYFKIFSDAEIRVYKTVIATGVQTELALTTDYTVSGAGDDAGGSVTLVSTLSSSYKLNIQSAPTIEQATDIRNDTGFFPDTIEDQLDRCISIDKAQQVQIDRSLKVAEGDTAPGSLPSAAARANTNMYFDANGDPAAGTVLASGTVSSAMADVVAAASLASARSLMGPWGDALVTSTGSTTARSLAAREATIVNVLDFGADNTGATNALTAVQAAITSLASTGGIVYFPAGTYLISAGRIFIRYSNITLRGAGWESILQWAGTLPTGPFGGTGGMITAYDIANAYPTVNTSPALTNIVIENLQLIGKGEVVQTAGSQGIQLENVQGGVIRNCKLSDFGQENILFNANVPTAAQADLTSYLVEGCHVSGGGNLFNTNGGDNVIRGNFFTANAFQGVELGSAGRTTVTGNVFKNLIGNIEILMDRSSTYRGGVSFTGNVVDNCLSVTVYTQSGSQPTSVVVSDNTIRKSNSTLGAIQCYGSSDQDARYTVSNNVISECVNCAGIYCVTGYGPVLTGNVIFPGPSGTTTYGIFGDANAKPIVMGNSVIGFTSTTDIVMANSLAVVGYNYRYGGYRNNAQTFTPTQRSGQVTIADDAVAVLTNSDELGAYMAGSIILSARQSATANGRVAQSSFAAHTGSISYHTSVFSHGSAPGAAISFYTTTLTGTTGTDGNISLSVNVSGGKWQIQVENRSGASVLFGWELLAQSL